MSWGETFRLWLAQQAVSFVVGVSVVALIFAAALIKVFVIDRFTERRAKRQADS